MENSVLDGDEKALVRIREAEIDRDLACACPFAVEANGKRVEKLFHGKRADLPGRALTRRVRRRARIAQLHGGGEIEGAPGTGLGLVAELFERVGLEIARVRVRRVGEDEMVHEFCDQR